MIPHSLSLTHFIMHLSPLSPAVKQARPPQPDVALISRPPIAPINDGNDPFAANRKGKPKRPRKKINKADIGLPSDFR